MDSIIPFPDLCHIPPDFKRGHRELLPVIDRAPIQYPPFQGRILGCRVLLLRVEENVSFSGRFLLPDTYQHGSVMFRVLAVGPGEWVLKKGGKEKRVWIQPETRPAELVISRHWTQGQDPRNAMWHQPEYIDNVDGSGRCIVDCRFIELKWTPPTK